MYSATPQFGGEGPGLQPSPAVTADASASPVTAARNSEYRGNAGGSAAATPKPIDKSGYNRNIKVSQSTVDATKGLGRGNMGVKAAQDAMAIKPRVVGGVLSSGPVAASAEQKESVSRVYPNAYAKAGAIANRANNSKSSGRSDSPYGFGGYNPRTSVGGGSSASATK
jgi:hypothetical protein